MGTENVVVFEEVNKANAQQQLIRMLCMLFDMKPEELMQMGKRLCAVERLDRRCEQIAALVGKTCCVGNVQYGEPTLDEYSDKDKIGLTEIVKDFGPNFVNSYPVAPGSSIRLTHVGRPGFLPTHININLSLANNGNNFLDMKIQFYIVPNNAADKTLGRPIGNAYEGSDFLQNDGTRIVVPFPTYRNRPVIIGNAERLAVTMTHGGGVNAINSASLSVVYDNQLFFAGCCTNCGKGDACTCSTSSATKMLPSS